MPAPRPAYVAIDVETTGLVPGTDHLYEIALVSFDEEALPWPEWDAPESRRSLPHSDSRLLHIVAT